MDKLLEFLKDEELFARPLTLLAGIIAIFAIEAFVDPVVKDLVTQGPWRRLGLYLFFQSVFVGVWWYRRRVLPQVSDGKIGLVMAVTTESARGRKRLKTDLVEKIRETIGQSKLTGSVEVVLLSNYQAGRVSAVLGNLRHTMIGHREHGMPVDRKAEKAYRRTLKRTRARGFIFGHISERLAGESNYILECHALVTTPAAKLEIQKSLDQDFGRIWTHRLQIEEKAESLGFPLSANLMFIPVAYIMGIAALMSRDVFYSFEIP